MKRVWQHPEEPKTGRRYWRSINELEKRDTFLKNLGKEFPLGDELNAEERENSRRTFLKLMGASVGMMGLASCRRPVINILPYTKSVEWIVPGKPLFYASAMPRPYGSTPLVVTTHEGRPTHLSGNPLHPGSSGGLDAFAQASVLDLYDPERSQVILIEGKKATREALDGALKNLKDAAGKNGGEGLAFLIGAEQSPTTNRLRAEVLKKFPKAKFFQYEAVSRDTQLSVNKQLLGAGVRPVVKLDKAARVLSLDCDFLGLDPVGSDSVAEFMKTRNAATSADAAKMSRLYAIENRYTLTGATADHRKPLASSLLPVAAALLAAKIDPSIAAPNLTAGASEDLKKWVETAAEDLLANKGKAVVLAGSRTSEVVQALAVAINNALGAYGSVIDLVKTDAADAGTLADLVAAVSSGAVKTIVSTTGADPLYDAPSSLNLEKTLKDKKTVLIHLGSRTNATAKAASIHIPAAHFLETWGDVTSAAGVYSIVQPMIQPLLGGISENEVLLALLDKKTFGAAADKPAAPVAAAPAAAGAKADAKAAPAAPAAAPAPAGNPDDPSYTAVRETFAIVAGGADEKKWNFTVRDGFLKGSAFATGGTVNASAVAGIVSKAKAPVAPSKGAFEVVLVPDASVWDGRYISNAWLQEAPDPVTKITWDNAAQVGSVTYRELGLAPGYADDGTMNNRDTIEGRARYIKITVGGQELTIPAVEAPGHAPYSITIPLGYGQEHTGVVGKGTGFNAYKLLPASGDYTLTGAVVAAGEGTYQLAITQEHNTMEGRSVYREGTSEGFAKNEKFAQVTGIDSHIPPEMSFYNGQFKEKKDYNNPEDEGFDYKTKHQWGMTIDLGKCIGCTACLIACQSENNIPIVGKDQVQKGRVMQWIRMDRYFATPERDDIDSSPSANALEEAEMVHQPVACQQCESAPCETVCPVNATVHTEEGLNAMAYNRCIGTRYCANNCPYTARRFNWFDYNKRNPLIETTVLGIKTPNLYAGPLGEKNENEMSRLQKNPNVSVRMRGVIEKCTYCVQRLEAAKITQIQSQRDTKNFRIATDSVKTACQQACPAGAIEFGDLANKDSTVVKLKDGPRNYEVLKYLNTRPRTSYLARIRNINSKMPGADKIAAWSAQNS